MFYKFFFQGHKTFTIETIDFFECILKLSMIEKFGINASYYFIILNVQFVTNTKNQRKY